MSPSRRSFNPRATRAAALGLLSGLVLLLAGDSGVRSAANSGIDPLETEGRRAQAVARIAAELARELVASLLE